MTLAARPGPATSVGIVSDDAAMRRSLAMLLLAEGFAVASGEGAPVGCRCLVIDDRRTDGSDGLCLAEALARQGEAIRVVVLADWPDAAFLRRAAAAGVVAVVEKPVLDDAVVRAVSRAVGRER